MSYAISRIQKIEKILKELRLRGELNSNLLEQALKEIKNLEEALSEGSSNNVNTNINNY